MMLPIDAHIFGNMCLLNSAQESTTAANGTENIMTPVHVNTARRRGVSTEVVGPHGVSQGFSPMTNGWSSVGMSSMGSIQTHNLRFNETNNVIQKERKNANKEH